MSSRRLRGSIVAVAVLAVAVPASTAAPAPGSVRVQRAPFAVTVALGGAAELRTSGAPMVRLADGRAVPLGRVVSVRRRGGRLVAELAAAAPSRARARLTAGPTRAGVTPLRLEVRRGDATATALGFAARPGERFLGFGERSDAVVRTRGDVESFVSDGPWAPEDRSIVDAFVPPVGFRARDDATYFPVPWLLSSRGHGVLALGDEAHRHRLGVRRWSVEADGRVLDVRVVAGPRPADALRRYTHGGPAARPRRGRAACTRRPVLYHRAAQRLADRRRAGPGPRATRPSCGAATRPSTGASTGCARRCARACRSA